MQEALEELKNLKRNFSKDLYKVRKDKINSTTKSIISSDLGVEQKKYEVDESLKEKGYINQIIEIPNKTSFEKLCKIIEGEFNKNFENLDEISKAIDLDREKRAILGYEEEARYYKEKIREFLSKNNLFDIEYPDCYLTLEEGIFEELYGLAGLAAWVYDRKKEYKNSSSAKLIGENLYCLIEGRAVLQSQKISKDKRNRLKRSFLMSSPRERIEYGFHEVYLKNGIRVTIFSGHRTKEGEDIMIFRKYLKKNMSFENLVDLGTIPRESIDLFKLMIKSSANVIFSGEVRSGKTTFLQVWQSYEDKKLEGIAIGTDIETPWERLMPKVPIMQIVADNKELEEILKPILRGDNDYVILEEMRDAVSFRIFIDMLSIGNKGCKATVHDNNGINVPQKLANKIYEKYGSNVRETIRNFYDNVDYVFEFVQGVDDKSKKILKGIIRFDYDFHKDEINASYIMKYDFYTKKWVWNYPFEIDIKDNIFDEYIEMEKVVIAKIKELSKGNSKKGWSVSSAYY